MRTNHRSMAWPLSSSVLPKEAELGTQGELSSRPGRAVFSGVSVLRRELDAEDDEEEDTSAAPPWPSELLAPDRWRQVVARQWRRPVAIHPGEGRAALMGLRREANCPASGKCLLLSLGGNLAELLSMERGRARERGLLGMAWQSAALQCASRRHRRYVDTARNPSDKGS